MPPGAQVSGQTSPRVAEARISLDDLHKRMQQSEGNASSIERQLNDVRTHLKTLREQVTLEETNVHSIDLDSLAACLQSQHRSLQQEAQTDGPEQPDTVTGHPNHSDRDEAQLVLEGVDVEFSRLKRKVDEVQAELQISWMSLSTLRLQLEATRGSGATLLADQLDAKRRALEQLSGSYERLHHAFIDKEEELRYERQLATYTLKALSVTHRDMDLKIKSIFNELDRFKALAVQLKDWCSTTFMAADEQCMQLKQLRADLASIASSVLHVLNSDATDNATATASVNLEQAAQEQPAELRSAPEACSAGAAVPKSTDMFREMSNRLELLMQELRSGKVEHDNRNGSVGSPTTAPEQAGEEGAARRVQSSEVGGSSAIKFPNVGKRKLSEAFNGGGQNQAQQAIEEREEAFLSQKKAFLSGLRDSFQRARQREVACASLDRRLLKVCLLLEQAQRGCTGSDSVAIKSKRQIEQAYKELLYVQKEIDSIKAMSMLEQKELPVELADPELQSPLSSPGAGGGGGGSTPRQTCMVPLILQKGGDAARIKEELGHQVELNARLKQQIAKLYLQAERAEGMVAVERLEVDKLREQVQSSSERLKHEARCLNESHTAALRARDTIIEQLRRQVERDETRKLLNAALEKNEELSLERDALLAKLGGQDLDLLKLRNENVCLVVEKIAFEGSARSLQEKMASLMSKLSETKQHWKRFVVYCQTF